MRRGSTLVEAAIVLPLLLLLTLGAIEYGWLFYNVQQITNAARQGARIAILPHSGAETEAATMINTLLTNSGLLDDLTGPPSFQDDPIPGDPDNRQQVTVRITVSTANLSLVKAPGLIPIPATLSCAVAMAKEGL